MTNQIKSKADLFELDSIFESQMANQDLMLKDDFINFQRKYKMLSKRKNSNS
jgi:hypothetical protein